MKTTNTWKAHKTENGRRTKCGLRIFSNTDLVNDEGMKIPSKTAHFKFEPYKYDGHICEKCNK